MFRRIVESFSGTTTPGGAQVTKENLFSPIPPDCDHDCDSCTIRYPAGFKIEEEDELWQSVKGFSSHIVIATGKTDWVRDVADEKGTIMEALDSDKAGTKPTNGKLMVSASNMCPPQEYYSDPEKPTKVLLLPSFTFVEDVKPKDVPELIQKFINPGPTTKSPLHEGPSQKRLKSLLANEVDLAESVRQELASEDLIDSSDKETNGLLEATKDLTISEIKESDTPARTNGNSSNGSNKDSPATPPPTSTQDSPAITTIDSYLSHRPCPHEYLILLCSHKHRDARCGQSAPLIRKELARHLRPLGLYRDIDDERPGGVGIYFINHVGGHKYSANMIVYRKKAGQGIWLARVKPQDIESIVKWTILEGKVRPEMIRGGFDRARNVASW